MVTGRLRQRSWETPEGDKRSVTELEADEVGASLKWALLGCGGVARYADDPLITTPLHDHAGEKRRQHAA
jgi:hypothetical protein